MVLKLHAFVALVLVSVLTAVAVGFDFAEIPDVLLVRASPTRSGSVALLVAFGVMLGRLLEVTGGAQVLADTLINRFGEKRAPFALGVAALLFGFPIFFDAGLVVFLPIIFTVARRFGGSLLYLRAPRRRRLRGDARDRPAAPRPGRGRGAAQRRHRPDAADRHPDRGARPGTSASTSSPRSSARGSTSRRRRWSSAARTDAEGEDDRTRYGAARPRSDGAGAPALPLVLISFDTVSTPCVTAGAGGGDRLGRLPGSASARRRWRC